jgi:hypothetical protein
MQLQFISCSSAVWAVEVRDSRSCPLTQIRIRSLLVELQEGWFQRGSGNQWIIMESHSSLLEVKCQ